MTEKLEYRVCPECGNIYTKKNVSHIMLGHITVTMSCEQGHTWEEFYSMTYQGYKYKDKYYTQFNTEKEELKNDV